ncbi:MAG: LysM peptidoglycan-binding domain-containing protein [Mariprofundaceae bacterium]
MVRTDELTLPQVGEEDIKPNLPQPYIVQKGDTLWDIAHYFFKNPMRWMKIWEQNLYISNPDLIYPGNAIWFSPKKKKAGGLSLERPYPQAVVKPVEKHEAAIDPSLLLSALSRQDFIQLEEMQGVGYIVDSQEDRINYGANDRVYIRLNVDANIGDVFDVFRTGDPVKDPRTGEVRGMLVLHLGKIVVLAQKSELYYGQVLTAFEELSRADRLKPAKDINTRIVPDYPEKSLQGTVLYIRNNAAEAGQNQVIGIDLGVSSGIQSGTVLSVHRAGRPVPDPLTGETLTLPEEKIGEMLVLVPQDDASIAIVTRSSNAINLGDTVRNQAQR